MKVRKHDTSNNEHNAGTNLNQKLSTVTNTYYIVSNANGSTSLSMATNNSYRPQTTLSNVKEAKAIKMPGMKASPPKRGT